MPREFLRLACLLGGLTLVFGGGNISKDSSGTVTDAVLKDLSSPKTGVERATVSVADLPVVDFSSSKVEIPSLYKFPYNISSTFEGWWTSDDIAAGSMAFENSAGTFFIRIVNVVTGVRGLHYVRGQVILRDGKYSTKADRRFDTDGLYLPQNGKLFLFANSQWKTTGTLGNVLVAGTMGLGTSKADLEYALNATLLAESQGPAKENSGAGGYFNLCDLSLQFQLARLLHGGPGISDAMPAFEAMDLTQALAMHENITGYKDEQEEKDGDGYKIGEAFDVPGVARRLLDEPDWSEYRSMDDLVLPAGDIKMTGAVASRTCHTHLTVDMALFDVDAFYNKGVKYGLVATALAFAHMYVLKDQMSYSSHATRVGKVQFFVLAMQCLVDSVLCVCHLAGAIIVEMLFDLFVTVGFFYFVVFSLFEMRFMILVWKATHPDAFNNGWDRLKEELRMLYSRFYAALAAVLCSIYMLPSVLPVLFVVLYSFWLPQIVLNAVQDSRKTFLRPYVVVVTLSRLFFPLYLYACPSNFWNVAPNPVLSTAIVLWLVGQATVLLMQDKWGPRFFVPARFLPKKYDYHRPIPLTRIHVRTKAKPKPDAEADALAASETDDEDPCVICMSSMAVPEGMGAKEARGNLMVTPCDHVFHTDCLVEWMEQKMDCPTCRFNPLPEP